MLFDLSAHDLVKVSFFDPSGCRSGLALVFDGAIEDITSKTILRIAIANKQDAPILFPERFVVQKPTPSGLLEFDATGVQDSSGDRVVISATLLGPGRYVQRRDFYRVRVGWDARYHAPSEPLAPDGWQYAQMRDVSLGGISMLLQDETLQIGQELTLEFVLGANTVQTNALVRNISKLAGSVNRICGVEFLGLTASQERLLEKAVAQAQLARIRK